MFASIIHRVEIEATDAMQVSKDAMFTHVSQPRRPRTLLEVLAFTGP